MCGGKGNDRGANTRDNKARTILIRSSYVGREEEINSDEKMNFYFYFLFLKMC